MINTEVTLLLIIMMMSIILLLLYSLPASNFSCYPVSYLVRKSETWAVINTELLQAHVTVTRAVPAGVLDDRLPACPLGLIRVESNLSPLIRLLDGGTFVSSNYYCAGKLWRLDL